MLFKMFREDISPLKECSWKCRFGESKVKGHVLDTKVISENLEVA